MKSLRYTVLLGLVVLLLAGCTALPPVLPGPTPLETPEARVVLPEATVAGEPLPTLPPPTAAATVALTATEPVTDTAETPDSAATPTSEQVMGANPLVGTVWEWAALLKTRPVSQSVVPDPSLYTITFGEDGEVLVRADCNSGSATYALENDALTIVPGPMTLVACAPDSLGDAMLTALSKVESYLIDGGDLILRVAETGDSMLFRNGGPSLQPAPAPEPRAPGDITAAPTEALTAAPTATAIAVTPTPTPSASLTPAPTETTRTAEAPALVGTTWQWERFVNVATGRNAVEVTNPENYTVRFAGDGTAAMKADCNQAAGTYRVDGGRLTVEVGPITLIACGSGSLMDAFLINLTSAASYTIEDGKLNIELMADGGRMVFGATE